MVNPNIQPLVLIFDLDETLFSVNVDDNIDKKKDLSSSAQRDLSKSQKGVIHNPVLLTQDDQEYKALTVTALARKDMQKVFNEIFDVIQNAKKQQINSPIAVKIITTGTYQENHIKKILDRLYFNDKHIFQSNRLPIEYYNYTDLTGEALLDPDEVVTHQGAIDLRKANLIKDNFNRWQKQMPGLKQERVILIDNADYNTEAVKYYHFTAFHYPTTPEDRLEEQSYHEQGKRVISKIFALIEDLKKSI